MFCDNGKEPGILAFGSNQSTRYVPLGITAPDETVTSVLINESGFKSLPRLLASAAPVPISTCKLLNELLTPAKGIHIE